MPVCLISTITVDDSEGQTLTQTPCAPSNSTFTWLIQASPLRRKTHVIVGSACPRVLHHRRRQLVPGLTQQLVLKSTSPLGPPRLFLSQYWCGPERESVLAKEERRPNITFHSVAIRLPQAELLAKG